MPIMPPRLQWFSLDGSGGKKTPLGRSNAFSLARTTPGCTRTQERLGVDLHDRVHVSGEVDLDARPHGAAVQSRPHAPGYH